MGRGIRIVLLLYGGLTIFLDFGVVFGDGVDVGLVGIWWGFDGNLDGDLMADFH